ncbi:MAG: hypothetical protein OXU73_01590 [Candidatus Campbellbacteria bacterium]|nr:hypothetical protein [Candidatus Campbellbacteria bacterium]
MQKQTNPALGKEGTTPLRVLVIDDSERHQKSARLTLADHDLTIIETHQEALVTLNREDFPRLYSKKVKEEMECLELNPDSYGSPSEYLRACDKAREEIVNKHFPPFAFDVVLCDLFMKPAANIVNTMDGRESLRWRKEKFAREEMPAGFGLVLMAVDNPFHSVKYAAVVTDTNHHDHPVSAMLDYVTHSQGEKPRFKINGATVGFYNSPEMVEVEGVCHACEGTGQIDSDYDCETCRGSGNARGKDWGLVLKDLLAAGETA